MAIVGRIVLHLVMLFLTVTAQFVVFYAACHVGLRLAEWVEKGWSRLMSWRKTKKEKKQMASASA